MKKSTPALRRATESDRMAYPSLPMGAWVAEGPRVLVIVDDFRVQATLDPIDPTVYWNRTYPTRQAARRVGRSIAANPEILLLLAV